MRPVVCGPILTDFGSRHVLSDALIDVGPGSVGSSTLVYVIRVWRVRWNVSQI